jgi:hypothetical protein
VDRVAGGNKKSKNPSSMQIETQTYADKVWRLEDVWSHGLTPATLAEKKKWYRLRTKASTWDRLRYLSYLWKLAEEVYCLQFVPALYPGSWYLHAVEFVHKLVPKVNAHSRHSHA